MAVALVVCRCRSVLRNVDFRGWDPNPKPKPPIWALESQNSLISNNGMRRAAELVWFSRQYISFITRFMDYFVGCMGGSYKYSIQELLMQHLQAMETLRCSGQKLTRVKWPDIVNYLQSSTYLVHRTRYLLLSDVEANCGLD
ncbi:hypothetical protein CFP56_008629 [Quercus suber]|uniref:Uncharacterized protein n=1 Tax=Quercus suber TaxID=58331 RepID=A0AAW0M7B1_QUESU